MFERTQTFAVESRVASLGIIAIALLALGVNRASASVILTDDFSKTTGGVTAANGDQPDTAKWSSTPTVFGVAVTEGTLDGLGHLQTSHSAPAVSALSSYGSTPGVDDLRLTVQLTAFSGSGYFGLENGNPISTWSAIYIRNDSGPNWKVDVYKSGTDHLFDTGVSTTTATGTWTIDWTASQIKVGLNNAPNTTITSGMPTAALYPFVNNYNGTVVKYDSITFEDIALPEPASASLLLGGGMLLGRRRRRV